MNTIVLYSTYVVWTSVWPAVSYVNFRNVDGLFVQNMIKFKTKQKSYRTRWKQHVNYWSLHSSTNVWRYVRCIARKHIILLIYAVLSTYIGNKMSVANPVTCCSTQYTCIDKWIITIIMHVETRSMIKNIFLWGEASRKHTDLPTTF
jgi:hypothetical protein